MSELLKWKIAATAAIWAACSIIIAGALNHYEFWVLPISFGPLIIIGMYVLWSLGGDPHDH